MWLSTSSKACVILRLWGVWGNGSLSHVWRCEIPQLAGESFSRRSFRVSNKEGLLRLTRGSTIVAGLFLSARTPHHGVDGWLRRGTLTMKAEQSNQLQKQTGLWVTPCSQTALIHMLL